LIAAAITSIELDGPTDLAGFRAAVRALVAEGIAADAVRFVVRACEPASLFDDDTVPLPRRAAADAPPLALPAGFAALCETVVMHDDPLRFARLYELAHALHHRRTAWQDTLWPPRIVLEHMAQAVRRELHKTKAFVRFRPVPGDDGVTHIAWFEPSHNIVHAVAPFFVRRFAGMRWALLTPRGSAHWSGAALTFGPPADRARAPTADDGEALWLAYYRSIFNPARVKLAMMKREMPVRFWPNLPEAASIGKLAAAAGDRTEDMLHSAAPRERRRGATCDTQARGKADLATQANESTNVAAQAREPTNLAAQARQCDRCEFAAQATQMVWGEGAPGAALMLVGEQPGDREDLEGRPFVGPAGRVLRDAIDTLRWPTAQLYLTNAVKHFKFEWRGKRRLHKTAAQREALACADWLEAEIAQIGPRAIVALGATAARSLLGASVAVHEHAGQWLQRADGLPVLVLQHPAALLRAAPAAQPRLHATWLESLRDASRYLQH
jgi:uracil-DNA glycosylase